MPYMRAAKKSPDQWVEPRIVKYKSMNLKRSLIDIANLQVTLARVERLWFKAEAAITTHGKPHMDRVNAIMGKSSSIRDSHGCEFRDDAYDGLSRSYGFSGHKSENKLDPVDGAIAAVDEILGDEMCAEWKRAECYWKRSGWLAQLFLAVASEILSEKYRNIRHHRQPEIVTININGRQRHLIRGQNYGWTVASSTEVIDITS